MNHSISIFEAWQQWLAGLVDREALLWGHSVVFWSRLGKIFELVGSFSIICDIVGVKRLREWGKRLASWRASDETVNQIGRIYLWFAVPFAAVGALLGMWWWFTQGEGARLLSETVEKVGMIWTVVVLISPLGWLSWVIPAAIGAMGGITVVGISGIFIVLLLRFFVAVIIYILDRPNGDVWLRLIYFNLLLFGFHFDLLGS